MGYRFTIVVRADSLILWPRGTPVKHATRNSCDTPGLEPDHRAHDRVYVHALRVQPFDTCSAAPRGLRRARECDASWPLRDAHVDGPMERTGFPAGISIPGSLTWIAPLRSWLESRSPPLQAPLACARPSVVPSSGIEMYSVGLARSRRLLGGCASLTREDEHG